MWGAKVEGSIGRLERCIVSPITWWLLGASVFVMTIYSIFLNPINHDVGFFLNASGRLLDGAILYQDIVEMNPPLNYFLNIPPVWAARLLGWSEITLLKIYILLLVLLSLVICWQVLNQTLKSTPIAVRRCLLLMLFFLVLRPHFFGQREHIMLVLSMPYILAAAAWAMERPVNGYFRLFIGILAGVGIALKPYFLLLWLMIESYLIFVKRIRYGWRRPENVVISIFLAGYGAFVFFGFPEYHKEIIPKAMQIYDVFNLSISYLFRHPYAILWGVSLLAFLLVPASVNHVEVRRILLIASMSFLIMAFVQRKGFYYHFYPAAATSVLLLVVIVFDSMETIGPIRRLFGSGKSVGVLAMILGLFVLTGIKFIQYSQYTTPLLSHSPLIRVVQEHAKGKPIFLFSTSIWPAFPLVNYSGARWPSRFANLAFLPSFYADVSASEKRFPYHTLDEMDALERSFMEEVISDIQKKPPVLLIADCSPVKQGFGKTEFDYIEYYLQDPRFAELWPSYELLTVVGNYRVFKYSRDMETLGDL